ncbi:MAG: hypothetical protein JNN08_06475 [Bryobacterales bacterium]|nr:hypothetical protein [Bryobacterales bacterium]
MSRIEQRSDLLLSTLRKTVEAMGGNLSLIAEFPDRPPAARACAVHGIRERDPGGGAGIVRAGVSGLEPVLSPDEKQVAFFLKGDVWVRDLARGTSTRLTFDSRLDRAPFAGWGPHRVHRGPRQRGSLTYM